ncbi:MAG: hypothetical protein KBT46_01765, partial [Ruminococcus sp.]|nr:hypothetical protein [Candidatus Copronaster equi]
MKLNSNDIILFSGDSITDGNRGRSMDCNHIMGHGFQYIISSRLAFENSSAMPKFYNKGYSGATMGDLLSKWQEDVLDLKPSIVSILAGTNDGMYAFNNKMTVKQAAENYGKNLFEAVEMTRKNLPDTKIIVCEPFYFPLNDKTTAFDYVPHPYCEENHGRPDVDESVEMIKFRIEADKYIRETAEKISEKEADIF